MNDLSRRSDDDVLGDFAAARDFFTANGVPFQIFAKIKDMQMSYQVHHMCTNVTKSTYPLPRSFECLKRWFG